MGRQSTWNPIFMRPRLLVPSVLSLLVVLLVPLELRGPAVLALSVARAESPDSQAKELVREGNRFYKQRDFEQALKRYEQAFGLRPSPLIVYNMGQCLRELGQLGQAVVQFRIFLTMAPDAPNRAQVQELIAELERRALAASPPSGPLPATPAAPSAVEGPRSGAAGDVTAPLSVPWYRRWYVWVPVAVVVAGAVAGGVLGTRGGSTPATPETDLGNRMFFGSGR
jgi:tetratricopeptide (TPR) repeat protein